ncbi:MAG: hypothetical protein AMXMBFR84_43260 [Candidatus Hydrogenedentota bacterium]
MSHYIVPAKVYLNTFIMLMIFMILTILAAFYVPHGPMGTGVAMGIAITKAALVVLFFMNVKYSSKLTWIFVISCFFWLGILLSMIIVDFLSRHDQPFAQPW